jgi:hypothetical protein
MNSEVVINESAKNIVEGFAGGLVGGAIAGFVVVVALLIVAGLYIYTSLAFQGIFKKLKYKKSWIAWIPVANLAVILKLGGFHWAWIFLILVPFLGWIALTVLLIISFWNVFEKLKYPGALSLILLGVFIPIVTGVAQLAFLVILGVVAWKK